MQNQSGLRALGRAVLIQDYQPEVASSVIEIPEQVRQKMTMVEQRAVVVAVGPECWTDERGPRAKPGDRVFVTKYAGFMTVGTKDGKPYRFVNDRDIFAGIEEEAQNG